MKNIFISIIISIPFLSCSEESKIDNAYSRTENWNFIECNRTILNEETSIISTKDGFISVEVPLKWQKVKVSSKEIRLVGQDSLAFALISIPISEEESFEEFMARDSTESYIETQFKKMKTYIKTEKVFNGNGHYFFEKQLFIKTPNHKLIVIMVSKMIKSESFPDYCEFVPILESFKLMK